MHPELPDHVRKSLHPAVAAGRGTRTSPYGHARSTYPRPRGQWFLLYGPLVGWAALMALGTSTSGPTLWALAAIVNAPILVACLWRVPQEMRRALARSWSPTSDGEALVWDDPSGEWSYARPQSTTVVVLLGWLVAACMPCAWFFALKQESVWMLVWLPFVIGVLVYVHRHLPTPLRRAQHFRRCGACGMKRGQYAVPVCPRCGRVAQLHTVAALPGLQRSYRVL